MNANQCRCATPKRRIHNAMQLPRKFRLQRNAVQIACGAATLCDDLDTPMTLMWPAGQSKAALPGKAVKFTPKDAEYYSTVFPDLYE